MTSIFIGVTEACLAKDLRRAVNGLGQPTKNFADGAALWKQVGSGMPSAIIVDWNFPTISGVEILFRIRERPKIRKTPVGILLPDQSLAEYLEQLSQRPNVWLQGKDSATQMAEKIVGLAKTGILRNAIDQSVTESNFRLDLSCMRAFWRRREFRLSIDEFRLFKFFLQNPNRDLSREELVEHVWAGRDVDKRSVDVVIGRMRRTVELVSNRRVIHPVRGIGYRFVSTTETLAVFKLDSRCLSKKRLINPMEQTDAK